MMALRTTCRDDFVTDFGWERDIQKIITMDMTNLSSPQPVLGPPESVGMGFDIWPGHDDLMNSVGCTGYTQ
jgi:hypothetical protein